MNRTNKVTIRRNGKWYQYSVQFIIFSKIYILGGRPRENEPTPDPEEEIINENARPIKKPRGSGSNCVLTVNDICGATGLTLAQHKRIVVCLLVNSS